MSSTRILLSHRVRRDHLMKVIGLSLGVELEKQSFQKQTPHLSRRGRSEPTHPEFEPFDPNRPSSDANPWFLDFSKADDPYFSIEATDSHHTTHRLHFRDAAGSSHHWLMMAENEHDEDSFLLFPDSTPTSVALGIKLCKFFGGSIKANSDRDEGEGYEWSWLPKRAQFPPKTASQTSNDRWHQFCNALNTFAPLKSRELEQAFEHAAYGWTERCLPLKERLQAQEAAALLQQALPDVAKAVSGPKPRL